MSRFLFPDRTRWTPGLPRDGDVGLLGTTGHVQASVGLNLPARGKDGLCPAVSPVHGSFIVLIKLPNVETLIFLVPASNQFMF